MLHHFFMINEVCLGSGLHSRQAKMNKPFFMNEETLITQFNLDKINAKMEAKPKKIQNDRTQKIEK